MSHIAPPPGTTLEVRRPDATTDIAETERGVIIHPAIHWVVAYFPGPLESLANPIYPEAIRVVDTATVVGYRALNECDPEWVVATWRHLQRCGPGLLQSSTVVRIWELAAELARAHLDSLHSITIRQNQLEQWAGRSLTIGDIRRVATALPTSSIPEAISTIVDGFDS